jgi:hypothetical protein
MFTACTSIAEFDKLAISSLLSLCLDPTPPVMVPECQQPEWPPWERLSRRCHPSSSTLLSCSPLIALRNLDRHAEVYQACLQ